ncbi:hypothetical protein M9H77_23226 [Catharanthus roseus]|uniref:Uncharacterized protein n=1 Tax=Catharanthus roseus TaxID=4058 RepID=A0ACC0AVF3_CATRO|nr:hypothetical protein M9H77_23226 [Catharanthus roseus]
MTLMHINIEDIIPHYLVSEPPSKSSNSRHNDPLRLIMQKLQSLRDEMRDIRRDITNLSNQQREVSPHGSLNVTTPRSNGPFNCSRTTEFHQSQHFYEELHPPSYGSRRGGFGGRGMPRHFEEVPRPQARHVEQLYDDHEHVPFVANRGRGQGDQTLDRMKWTFPSFMGENDPNLFLDWEMQVENMFMLKIFNEFLKARLVIAEFFGYALHWWEKVVNQRVRSGRPPSILGDS